jgi:hypothetical protein
VVEEARYQERRANVIAVERKKDSSKLQHVSNELEKAKSTIDSLQREQFAWRTQQWEEMRAMFHQEVQQTVARMRAEEDVAMHQTANEELEGQMVEQLLVFEQQVDHLRDVNTQLAEERSTIVAEHERLQNEKIDEIMSLRRNLHANTVSIGSVSCSPESLSP